MLKSEKGAYFRTRHKIKVFNRLNLVLSLRWFHHNTYYILLISHYIYHILEEEKQERRLALRNIEFHAHAIIRQTIISHIIYNTSQKHNHQASYHPFDLATTPDNQKRFLPTDFFVHSKTPVTASQAFNLLNASTTITTALSKSAP